MENIIETKEKNTLCFMLHYYYYMSDNGLKCVALRNGSSTVLRLKTNAAVLLQQKNHFAVHVHPLRGVHKYMEFAVKKYTAEMRNVSSAHLTAALLTISSY